jgi:hypothetical protein
MLVGEDFGAVKNQDPLYQWCFGSFSGTGCSQWLTYQLQIAGINEQDVMWVNADQPFERLTHLPTKIVALGAKASVKLAALGLSHQAVYHPQHHKRFHAAKPYDLINVLKEIDIAH